MHTDGGDGEIRTLAPVSRPTPLAGAPLRPLEYFSKGIFVIKLPRVRDALFILLKGNTFVN